MNYRLDDEDRVVKKIRCIENCNSGWYKTRKPCCHHSCQRSDVCQSKCKETPNLCGCVKLK